MCFKDFTKPFEHENLNMVSKSLVQKYLVKGYMPIVMSFYFANLFYVLFRIKIQLIKLWITLEQFMGEIDYPKSQKNLKKTNFQKQLKKLNFYEKSANTRIQKPHHRKVL